MNRSTIRFKVNGTDTTVHVAPSMPLQRVIRDVLGLTGTKDGCKEGECGACAVLLDGEAVDSCLIPVCQVQGRSITTIEAFQDNATPHPLLEAFADQGAVHCGYCTPGFVIAAAGLLNQDSDPDRETIVKAMAGHLCRCTGYETIIEAVRKAAPHFHMPHGKTGQQEKLLDEPDSLEVLTATSVGEIRNLPVPAHRPVRFLAGGTDLMVQKAHLKCQDQTWIDISGCNELKQICLENQQLRIGALVTHRELTQHPLVRQHAGALAESSSLLGSDSIARRATLGGNLANASPAADSYPPLTALNAKIFTSGPGGSRYIPVLDLASAPGRTILDPMELIQEIIIPIHPASKSGFFKGMPRHAQCLAKVSAAISIGLEGKTICRCGIALGAVGPTVIQALEAESVLMGCEIDRIPYDDVLDAVLAAARPITDFRSDKQYRLHLLRVGSERLLKSLLL